MSENNGNTLAVLKAFLIGSIIGAGVALIFAPQSGEETRKKLSEKTDDAKKALKDTTDQLVKRGHEVVDEGRKSIESLRAEMGKLVDEGKKSIGNIRQEISGLVEEGKSNLKKTIKDEIEHLEEELSEKKSRKTKA